MPDPIPDLAPPGIRQIVRRDLPTARTLDSEEYPVHTSAGEFVFTTGSYYMPEGTKQTFLGTAGAQRLNVVVEVAEPGEYQFHLVGQGSNAWFFYSCEVTKVKK